MPLTVGCALKPEVDLAPGLLIPRSRQRSYNTNTSSRYFPLNVVDTWGAKVNPSLVGAASVTWLNHTVWRIGNDGTRSVNDPWALGSALLPMYKALRLNDTGMLPFVLPPLGADSTIVVQSSAEKYVCRGGVFALAAQHALLTRAHTRARITHQTHAHIYTPMRNRSSLAQAGSTERVHIPAISALSRVRL